MVGEIVCIKGLSLSTINFYIVIEEEEEDELWTSGKIKRYRVKSFEKPYTEMSMRSEEMEIVPVSLLAKIALLRRKEK